jgi:hypothetical protein
MADEATLISEVCAVHCGVCEGMDHHWMPECDDDGEPVMVCKHCPAVREIDDDEEWD